MSKITLPVPDAFKHETYKDHGGNDVYIRSNGTRSVTLSFIGDPGLTVQSHKESCDIGYIVDSHLRLGGVPPMPESAFNDFSEMPDYQTALNTVMAIDELFSNLPIKIKSHFDNNPAALMAAVEDPSQRDTLIELGVFTPKDGPSPVIKAPAVDSNPAKPDPA